MSDTQLTVYAWDINSDLIERRFRVCDFYDINNLSAPLPDFCIGLDEDEVCLIEIIGKNIDAQFQIDPKADMPETVITPEGDVIFVYEKDESGLCRGRAQIIFEKEESQNEQYT